MIHFVLICLIFNFGPNIYFVLAKCFDSPLTFNHIFIITPTLKVMILILYYITEIIINFQNETVSLGSLEDYAYTIA